MLTSQHVQAVEEAQLQPLRMAQVVVVAAAAAARAESLLGLEVEVEDH